MEYIERYHQKLIESRLFNGKSIILLGARRVGKTFFCKRLIKKHNGTYYNCELQETKDLLATKSKVVLEGLVKNKQLIVFDEAQVIPDIGSVIKIIHDTFPGVQVIATGSSSFDLINATAEPLTGRSRVFNMYPLSLKEIVDNYGIQEAQGKIESIMQFGAYPEVYQYSEKEKREELENIASNYLYKDVLIYGDIKKPDILIDILRLLAFQIGSETSLNKISNQINTSIHTVKRYLDLLEKTYVLFSIGGFSRNLNKEIGKSKKYYFYDLGIRNAIIKNFNPLHLRNDVGSLWENFCVLERMKRNEVYREFKNTFFWRTYDMQEIDYIEEYDGMIDAYEFKYKSSQFKKPKIFLDTYKNSTLSLINTKNIYDFVL